MKSNRLFESLNDIDDKIVEEASIEEYIPQKKVSFMKVLIPIAAAIALFMIVPDFLIKDPIQPVEDPIPPIADEELTKISIGSFNAEGAGFESFMAYDIEELINANPWKEDLSISSLPVYKNTLEYERGIVTNLHVKAMRERLDETINLLKINSKDIEIINDYPTEEEIKQITEKLESVGEELTEELFTISQIEAKNKKYEITVYTDLSIAINFKPKAKLLKNYYVDYSSPYKDVYRTAEYAGKEYKDILGMKEPLINIYDGDYTYNGDQRFQIGFFDGRGSLEDRIINYNLNQAGFYFDEEDKSNTLIIDKPDLSQKIGNYPIISSKQAEELLIDNKYITNAPEDFPSQEYIKKVELVYRGKYEENFMPYYIFYVELENLKEESGLNTYAAYYVPAVKEEYIDNMDIMDAKFN